MADTLERLVRFKELGKVSERVTPEVLQELESANLMPCASSSMGVNTSCCDDAQPLPYSSQPPTAQKSPTSRHRRLLVVVVSHCPSLR